jgi:hypothetical protein
MAEQKTKPTEVSLEEFLSNIPDEAVRQDCRDLARIMSEATGYEPVMWGKIVGFGKYHYRYASGHEGDSVLVGFSPRKDNLSIYLTGIYTTGGFERYPELMGRLGKYKHGKGCLYIKHLADADESVLRELIRLSTEELRRRYPDIASGTSPKNS